ncbi:immunity 8 family protein [Amycolatopsis sp. BJA-103]|uniref:immunity 8 family protein n=1 Tax=Amycolatopsis sp. BJA-103 TaxID=1911175 RepID=UPI000C7612A2|nr:immunity 8 family protein [Amycolatopsis sp. BJA-103]AUI60401.1 hypothetical protein BKN51_20855 [Amycolatopsis sp. BJA-103]PNE16425.1 hypothetical protein B1H26_24480 [Amycolatopsis sp. BJA-103]
MHAEIRYLHTPDMEPDTYVPDDPDRFLFLVQMLAGPVGEPGEESFDFEVCTPGWLHQQVQQDGLRNGRHHVIVDTFDWPALQTYFQNLVATCTGADWNEVSAKLARYGRWEFEDYTPAPDKA